MLPCHLDALNMLSTPIWIINPDTEDLIFANSRALTLSDGHSLTSMRTGTWSAHAQRKLSMYLSHLKKQDDIVEILTLPSADDGTTLSCKITLATLEPWGEVLIFEGMASRLSSSIKTTRTTAYRPRKHGFYARFFYTTSAPILLIDPARDGQIVDANLAALRFYGYTYDRMCELHTWEINALGRNVMPLMTEISHLPGGHKPLNFIHKLADGSIRHVQTYAGPIEIYGDRLMLCIIHDITEQKRLEQELEYAAHRDSLTELLNRRQFYHLTEPFQPAALDFSLLLVDIDHFKSFNDRFGHQRGDEVLVKLARTLESCSRGGDFVFRWGGEEFLLLLPNTALENAVAVAESVRAAVASIEMPGLPSFTVSIGVARKQPEEDMDELFKRVDDALYRAKNNGRNKVLAA
nr:sensor domain-containing diguanylate cyclase [uncultured Enterobacter sp.]